MRSELPEARVVGVAADAEHRFNKTPRARIVLVEGHGVDGDAHAGPTVQHRSRVAADPTQPNLRQVHLLHSEFLEMARQQGYDVAPGDLGENILTAGVDLLALPRDTLLHTGRDAVVRVTGLRNPCLQIDSFRKGLLSLAVGRGHDGQVVRRAGVMGVVLRGGVVTAGDPVRVVLPAAPHHPLVRV